MRLRAHLTCEQAHGTLGTVDACVLLAAKPSDAESLIRRVVDRGREPVSVAEPRVRKNIPDTARAWAIVGALAGQLRGVLAEVDAMQVTAEFRANVYLPTVDTFSVACRVGTLFCDRLRIL